MSNNSKGLHVSRRVIVAGVLSSVVPFTLGKRTLAATQTSTLVGILEEDPPVMNSGNHCRDLELCEWKSGLLRPH